MKRSFGLDVIRTFAVFFVLCTHFFLNTNFYKVPFTGNSMLFQAFLRWTFIICVPLFLMLTGYLQTKKELDVNYYENIIPLLGIYILYSVLSILVRTFYFKEQEPTLVWLSDIVAFKANGYSWYINMYIGLYLLIPFLNIIFNNIKSQKEHKKLILTMVFMTGLPGFFNNIPGHINILRFPDWWLILYPITYYFLGAYIREYQIKMNKIAAGILFISVVSIETFISAFYSRGRNFYNAVGDYGSILILIQTVLFFLIFYDIETNNRYIKIFFTTISVISLDIYLCSYISDRIVYDYVMNNLYISQQQIIYYFVFIIVTTFTLSAFVAFIRYKINDARLNYLNNPEGKRNFRRG